jgi:hypothetical protein
MESKKKIMTINLNAIGTYATGIFDESAAEIPAYDPQTQRLFVVNANQVRVDVLDISDPSNPEKIGEIDASAFGGVANSVAVANGLVVVAVEDDNKQLPGSVAFFASDTDNFDNPLNILEVGSLPDMVTFTPDGNKVVVANEGEPNDTYTVDPEGSISIIDVSNGVEGLENRDVETADFRDFNDQERELINAGVRIFGPDASVAEDLEPEYIAVSDDSQTAYVTLQENNALAVVDLDSAEVIDIVPLGFKDHSEEGNELDASNEDGAINISNWPIFGMYQPDSVDLFTVDGESYLITANEGDARVYPTQDLPDVEEGGIFNEESRIADLDLDADVFPNADELQQEDNLGRLKVTNTLGVDEDTGEFTELYAFGGRSFSIWNTEGELIFDSGDRFEQDVAEAIPDFFNATNDDNDSFDDRSDDKGPEPEGVAVGEIDGEIYGFIGLERVGGVMVYNITDPTNPQFETYINNRNFVDAEGEIIPTQLDDGSSNPEAGDLGPEGLTFISAEDSSNGQPLLVASNEVSGNTTIFAVDINNETGVKADFNNDGISDLVWRNEANGNNGLWLMSDVTQSNPFGPAAKVSIPEETNLEWAISGTGDFNGNGTQDLVWRNFETGSNGLWLMNGVERRAIRQLDSETNTNWYIGGVGYANDDTVPDLYWRNETTGNNGIWYLNENLEVTAKVAIQTENNLDWEMVAVDDMNEDDVADIVWRNQNTGQNGVWLMGGQGGQEVQDMIVLTEELNSTWNIRGTGDYNGDGFADLVWRNEANGNNGVWFYDGDLNRLGTLAFATETNTNWQIVQR